MTVKSAQVWSGVIVCKDATGALSAASVGPVGALYVDGTSNAAAVTITGANPYKWTVTLPTLTAGQCVSMYITATVDSIATASVVAEAVADTVRLSDGVTLQDDAITAAKIAANAITSSELDATAIAEIADGVWDEILSGATHNIATSAGRRLREITSTIIRASTAQGGAATYITLDASASATDGAYDPALVAIVGGTGIGQSRLIMEYNGTTKRAYVDRDWKTTPDATSEFVIYADAGREHTNEGVLTAATSTTASLNAWASTTDDIYNDCMIFIRTGTGEDQVRHITDYDGATKTVTVDPAWETTPVAGDVYTILPFVAPDSASDILNTAVEGTYTMSEVLQLMAAVLFGKASGGGTTTVTFRDTGDSADRVTAVVDSDGNRTAVTLNV